MKLKRARPRTDRDREAARKRQRLARNSGTIRPSGHRWHTAKLLKPTSEPKPGEAVLIVECGTCACRVGSYDRALWDVDDEGKWVKHAHQPTGGEYLSIFNAPGKNLPLTPADFSL